MANGDQLTTDDLPDDGISRYVYGQEGTASEGGIWFQDASGTLHELGAPTGPDADPISMLDEETVASWEAQGYTPVWNGQTGRWEPVAPKMPQSWQQEALSALMADDEDKAQNIWKFFNQMSQGDQVDLALRLTTTPGDYMTYWSLLRQRQQARGYNPGERIIPLPEFLTSTIGQSLGLDTGTDFAPEGPQTSGEVKKQTGDKQYEWGQYTPADMTAFEEGTRGTAPVTTADINRARDDMEAALEIERQEGMGHPLMGGTAPAGVPGGPLQTGGPGLPGEHPLMGASANTGPQPTTVPGGTIGTGSPFMGPGDSAAVFRQPVVPNMGATGVPTLQPVGFRPDAPPDAQPIAYQGYSTPARPWAGPQVSESLAAHPGGGGAYKDRFGTTYGSEPATATGGAAATGPVVNRQFGTEPVTPADITRSREQMSGALLPFESPDWRRFVGYNPDNMAPYTAAARPMTEAQYVTNTPAPAIEYPQHLTPDTGGPRPEFPNRTPPVPAPAQVPYSPELGGMRGYAKGGIVGLHGPEVALLGEYGPEYVVPMFKGQPLGLKTLGPSYDATGPIPRSPEFGYTSGMPKQQSLTAMGAPIMPSAQAWSRMLPTQRSSFQHFVKSTGLPVQDYMAQMQKLMPKFPSRGRRPTVVPRFV